MALNPAQKTGDKYGDLKRRLFFLLGALIVYRIGTHVPVPGINASVLEEIFKSQQGGILGLFNVFSGGALQRFSILALGIMPYISASIIMQLASVVVPSLEALKKEGEAGRRKITQYTRYGTLVLAFFQAMGIAIALESQPGLVMDPGIAFRLITAITLVTGTMFLMWLGEQITSRGIGNGISLIILSGIVAELPAALANMLELVRQGAMSTGLILVVIVMAVVVIAFIVFMERAQRRLLIQYPKRQVGNKMFEGQSSHLPLKLNTSGVIPAIFASSLLLLPATLGGFAGTSGPDWLVAIMTALGYGRPLHIAIYVLLIVFFSFFYTSIVFNPQETADNLRKNGGFVPGYRPGQLSGNQLLFGRVAWYMRLQREPSVTRGFFLGAVFGFPLCLNQPECSAHPFMEKRALVFQPVGNFCVAVFGQGR